MLRILLVAFFFLAALPTSAQAGFDEGHKAYSEKNWEVAIRNLRPLAEMGDARAMVVLGNMYLDGLGVGKDLKEAFNLYRKAAIRDNPDAMVMVGALYQGGIGVKKNVRYAAEWFGIFSVATAAHPKTTTSPNSSPITKPPINGCASPPNAPRTKSSKHAPNVMPTNLPKNSPPTASP